MDTETTYVNGLRLLIDLYLRPITARLESKKKPILTKDVVTAVFSNLGKWVRVGKRREETRDEIREGERYREREGEGGRD